MAATKTTKTDRAAEAFDTLTAQVIEAIENDPGAWTKPWTETIANSGLPYSVGTGRAYTGGNVLVALGAQITKGYSSSAWGTFNQWAEFLGLERTKKGKRTTWSGPVVEKGEKATFLLRPEVRVIDKDRDGSPLPEDKVRRITTFRAFPVFNACQVVGALEKLGGETGPEPSIESAEAFVTATGARISHSDPSGAYYLPGADVVNLPKASTFESIEAYYSTVAHELVHWTGHRSRLDRDGVTGGYKFGSAEYGFEELVAELGAVFVGTGILGLTTEPRSENAAYLAGWLSTMRQDPRFLWTAASKAAKATEFLSAFSA